MEYTFVEGTREGCLLVYVPQEKNLYVFKIERNNVKEYICYQTILAKPRKEGSQNEHEKCSARVKLINDKICVLNMAHTCHQNHERILQDLQKRNNMKKNCKTLKQNFPIVGHRISTRDIFQTEYVRYDLYF